MTEAERNATQRMQQETARHHPKGKMPGSDIADAPHGTPAPQTKVSGTRVLPMPADSGEVAGMPRERRLHTEPGNPGIPAPENQVVGKDAPELKK